MRDDAVIIAGGVALLVLLVSKAKPIEWGAGWVFPVPDVRFPDGKTSAAIVTQEFKPGPHMGVDVMFRSGSTYFAPVGTPIVAARAGKVWSVKRSPRGWSVVLDHGKPFATFYQHLETVAVSKGSTVAAGSVIGTMGIDPLDAARVRHLHFAVWHNGAGDSAAVDPETAMRKWARPMPWLAPKG